VPGEDAGPDIHVLVTFSLTESPDLPSGAGSCQASGPRSDAQPPARARRLERLKRKMICLVGVMKDEG
jgi:hypothetical protein